MNNLLLLEDDIGLIDGLQYSLNKNGFHVDIARTVEEAKICLREINKYDLLILDVTLPDGTGFDVCEKVRKQNAQIPIIFLTASDEEVNVIRGLDCGGDKDAALSRLREKIGDGRVLLALSGGVDSSVAAALLAEAVGRQLTCVFVDHGLMRLNEGD